LNGTNFTVNKSTYDGSIDTDQLEAFVHPRLSENRWQHVLGVVETGKRLTEVYSEVNKDSLRVAAYLHDTAKELPEEEQRSLADRFREGMTFPENEIPALWHAPASAQLAVDHFELDPGSPPIVAVSYHPTGHPSIAPLLMALMVADFAEPNREFPAARQVRRTIDDQSLPRLARRVIKHKISHCLERNSRVHPWSLGAYNELCD
jgi:predicted HD superfamily hydrolase involved in NAD metabolism